MTSYVTLPTAKLFRPSSVEELAEFLNSRNVPTGLWGTGNTRPIGKLFEDMTKNMVFLEDGDGGSLGAHHRLLLHVYSVVGIIWYMGPILLELREARQIFPNGRPPLVRNFDGIGETMRKISGSTLSDGFVTAEVQRLFAEELSQTEPLFKDPTRYQLTYWHNELMDRRVSEKWPPMEVVFHRKKRKCELPRGSPLFHPEGYRELTDDGRVIEFEWIPI